MADLVRIDETPIDAGRVAGQVEGPGVGGVVTFTGVVRDSNAGREVRRLEYHAYPAMARKEMDRLTREVREQHDVLNVALVHRIGMLEVGELAVVVAVGAGHRDAAFAAARWLIDRLKERVPIWKKEYFAGGEVWIEGPARDEPGGV